MKYYLIAYLNKNNETFIQRVYAKNQMHALQKLHINALQVIAITKLDKSIKEIQL